ncbi:hypothetical protein KPATCC21470_0075 [Kitasatospora purpeofusca]
MGNCGGLWRGVGARAVMVFTALAPGVGNPVPALVVRICTWW